MATNFPVSLDAFTNPGPSSFQDDPTVYHDVQHVNLNDGLAAVQAYVGITGSAVTSTLTNRLDSVRTWLAFGTIAANLIFAGPASAGPSNPTWRALVKADLPAVTSFTDQAATYTALQTFRDNTIQVVNAAAPTKVFALSCSPITAGNTRTWSVPDRSDTFAGLGAQTFTGAQSFIDGSAGTPAIKRSATNDGFYFTAGTILVAISGTQRHYLQNDRIISNANAAAVGTGGLTPSMGPGHTLWGADGAGTGFNSSTFGAAPVNYFRRADNTGAAPAAVASSVYLGGMFFQTYDGSAYIENARIAVLSNQLQAVGSSGSRISLQVTPNSTASLSEVASITGSAATWTVPLVTAAGSAGAVSVSLVDAGNGLYRPSANVLAFATSGAFAMAIGSNGVVMPDGQGAATGLATFNASATTPRLQQNTVNAGRASHAMSVFGTSLTAAPEVIFGRSNNGTYATYTATTSGFVFGRIGGEGVDTTATQFRRATCIVFEQDGASGATAVPGLIRLQTAIAAGTLTDGLVLNALQQVVFGASVYIGSERARFAGGTIATAGVTDVLVGGGSIDMGTALRYRGTQVVGARKTGWATWTGTATRTAIATGSATLANVAEAVKAIIDDLHATAGHGLIGT